MKAKRHQNRVLTLYSENGRRITDLPEIATEFIEYYKNLLGRKVNTLEPDPAVISDGPILMDRHRNELESPITNEEIKHAVFTISDEKAPGPDGYSASFFESTWNIISADMIKVVQEFFSSGKLLGSLNTTTITLIPKVLNPSSPSEFRPISCCNCVYKVISKVITARIQKVTGYLVNDAQCAFVKGRIISNNILLAHELVKHYDFSRVSGLEANSNKCAVYLGGVEENVKNQICSLLSFSEGSLPIRYLGMPLISKRLSHLDCSNLISKISEQIQGWQSRRKMSYAGRIQLIKTVIMGIQNYWTNSYILPIRVLQKIDKLCSDFLWNCKMHLISWRDVCTDRKMGGLGIYSAKTWNYAAAMKLLWMIHTKKDILWIKWVHENYIHQVDIWQVQARRTDSWMWRQLLKVRDLALNKFGDKNNLQRVMKECYDNGKIQISEIYKALTHSTTPIDTMSGSIWGGLHYPKHSVILWLANHSRLLTKERLCKMGMITESLCTLCASQQETCKHLFFECQYSAAIWNGIMEWLCYSRRSCNWDQVVNWYSAELKGKGYMKKVKRMALSATVYWIWKERNLRIFQGKRMALSATVYWIWKERNLRIFQGKHHTPVQLIREVKISILTKVLNKDILDYVKEKIGGL
ncbi:uncharacterized protein LOC109844697 [Asparagus officinalis]|uniref:uncharacterized protein LOC109844697 n=1 Tax=Asparagus officinalis TaxID=4686 RepID=UPI00098E1139|nr:uncharacterized protein LOC109844697 [Asparagus officinalis]